MPGVSNTLTFLFSLFSWHTNKNEIICAPTRWYAVLIWIPHTSHITWLRPQSERSVRVCFINIGHTREIYLISALTVYPATLTQKTFNKSSPNSWFLIIRQGRLEKTLRATYYKYRRKPNTKPSLVFLAVPLFTTLSSVPHYTGLRPQITLPSSHSKICLEGYTITDAKVVCFFHEVRSEKICNVFISNLKSKTKCPSREQTPHESKSYRSAQENT